MVSPLVFDDVGIARDGTNDVEETSEDENLSCGVGVEDRPDVKCASAHEGTTNFSARGTPCLMTRATPGFRFGGGGDEDRLGDTDPLDGGECEGVWV